MSELDWLDGPGDESDEESPQEDYRWMGHGNITCHETLSSSEPKKCIGAECSKWDSELGKCLDIATQEETYRLVTGGSAMLESMEPILQNYIAAIQAKSQHQV